MSAAAPWGRAVLAQGRMEARLTARRGENLLAMIAIPVGALIVFGVVGPPAGGRDLGSLLPGVLALAIVASGLVNLGIATAYERGYGVLKRLGGAPLGRDGLIAAKVAVVVAIGAAQILSLVVIALILGWRPGPEASPGAVAVTTLVGTTTFAGLGLLLAGTLRPEAALVVANALFLVPAVARRARRPDRVAAGPMATLAELLPFGALAGAFAAALGAGGELGRHLVMVVAWGLGRAGRDASGRSAGTDARRRRGRPAHRSTDRGSPAPDC